MARQAQILSRETNRPVIDKTGIDGGQVFELRWAVNGVDAHRSHCLRYSTQFRNSWAFIWNPTNRSFLRQTVREALQTEGFLFSLGREAFTLGLFSGRPQGRLSRPRVFSFPSAGKPSPSVFFPADRGFSGRNRSYVYSRHEETNNRSSGRFPDVRIEHSIRSGNRYRKTGCPRCLAKNADIGTVAPDTELGGEACADAESSTGSGCRQGERTHEQRAARDGR